MSSTARPYDLLLRVPLSTVMTAGLMWFWVDVAARGAKPAWMVALVAEAELGARARARGPRAGGGQDGTQEPPG